MSVVTVLNQDLLTALVAEADALPRRRKNLNLHAAADEPVQKLFNAMQADSYVRPHRHPEKEKTELFIAVRGSFAALIFNDQGIVTDRFEFSAGGEIFGAEIRPDTWHTVIALQDGAVFFEVKQGPYAPLSDKDFAVWAPMENSAGVHEFMQWLQQARVGDRANFH